MQIPNNNKSRKGSQRHGGSFKPRAVQKPSSRRRRRTTFTNTPSEPWGSGAGGSTYRAGGSFNSNGANPPNRNSGNNNPNDGPDKYVRSGRNNKPRYRGNKSNSGSPGVGGNSGSPYSNSNNYNNNNNNNNMSRNNGSGRGSFNDNEFTESTPSDSFGSASWYSVNKTSSGNIIPYDSGVKSGLVYNRANRGETSWSPLFIQCGELFPPYSVTVGSDNYLDRVIIRDIYNETLRVVRLQTTRNIDTEFSLAKWYDYTYNVTALLQVYYMYDSLQAYITDSRNQNQGLEMLYKRISPSGWQAFSEAKLALAKQFIHPRMHELIHFMYQNFTPTPYDASTVIRLSWNDSLMTDLIDDSGFVDGTTLRTIMDALSSPTNLEVMTLMNRGFPNWRIDECKASHSAPIYNEDFMTYWSNSSVTYYDEALVTTFHTKGVGATTTKSQFVLFKNDVDGVMLSLNSVALYLNPGYKVYGGMWQPMTNFDNVVANSNQTSLVFYDSDDQLQGQDSTDYLSCSGIVHNTTHGGAGWEGIIQSPFGTKQVLVASIDSLEQVCNDAYRYLLYPSTAP